MGCEEYRIAFVITPIIEWDGEILRPGYLDRVRSNPHLGPNLLAGVLESHDIDVTVVDLVCRASFEEKIAEELEAYDIIFLSSNSTNWPGCALLACWLKRRNPRVIIVLGGIHATLFAEDILRRYPIDYIIRGEGEKTLIPLLSAIRDGTGFERVPGLVIKTASGNIIQNQIAELLTSQELDDLPLPLYDRLAEKQYRSLTIESSRGCFGNCAFCAVPFKKSWRPMSPERFVDKIELLESARAKTLYRYFTIVDDCFTSDNARAIAISKIISDRSLDFQATYDARVTDLLNEELLEAIAPYTKGVLVGAESFLPDTLLRIGKNISPESIEKCAKLVHKYGIAKDSVFSFIIGFPWETKQDIRENISRIAHLSLTWGIQIYLQWHLVTPGSRLWNKAISDRLLKIEDIDEVEFITSERWFRASSSLSDEDLLYLSDIVFAIKKVVMLTAPNGIDNSAITFMLPPHLAQHPDRIQTWLEAYERRARPNLYQGKQ
ncbi:B12-binding domain-containing radical SAM protein [Chlorobium ferrooxidans]|uniref:Cobalamin B12-binding:Radical SAM n=1 Tax=Chlorobium ferrooxidans DSM 13031 TaxID=377431 RepID=Q0YRQ9_9CHLB|nr:radical SAM protein [Chlorobium ferrooxidans]EAT58997.1 Cobalamin B12-binding:Radical SAM [Chlorobium ferrooxidans DSM 13031]